MTVAELIEALKTHDQDREVVLSKDAEGNGHSLFDGTIFEALYTPDGYEVEVHTEHATPEEAEEAGNYYREADENNIPCIVLVP